MIEKRTSRLRPMRRIDDGVISLEDCRRAIVPLCTLTMSMTSRRSSRRDLAEMFWKMLQSGFWRSLNATARWWFSRTDSSLYMMANSESKQKTSKRDGFLTPRNSPPNFPHQMSKETQRRRMALRYTAKHRQAERQTGRQARTGSKTKG